MMTTKQISAFWCVTLLGAASAIGQTSDASPANSETSSAAIEKKTGVLLPEGYWVDGRLAKLVKHPDQPRWFLLLERSKPAQSTADLSANPVESLEKKPAEFLPPDPADPFSVPIEVLPGKALASMDMITNQQTDLALDFRIWGEVTVYHGRNFILPSHVATLSLFRQRSSASAEVPESPLQALAQSKSSQTASHSVDHASPSPPPPLPAMLRDILLQMPRTYPLEWAEKSEPSGPPAASGAAIRPASQSKASVESPVRWKDGDVIIDRVGRLLLDPTEKKWFFAFEADGASLAEPPIILQPCKLLENMESLHHSSLESVQFRVSGQISRYQGRYYLLLRKMLLTKKLGNFGR